MKVTTYATDTSVPVERSRAEIEGTLAKYGATRFGYMTDETEALIGFVMNTKAIKFRLPLPNPRGDVFTKGFRTYLGRKVSGSDFVRDPDDAHRLWEQACRSKWRSLALCIKAKCEAVAAGITTFEEEFLAHIVTPGGRTVGQRLLPQLDEMQRTGKLPSLLLTE